MMVFKLSNSSGSNVTIVNGSGTNDLVVGANSFKIVPADMCSWDYTMDSNSGGYTVGNVLLKVEPTSTTAGTPPDFINIAANANITAELGVIGKSGRFVAFTN